MRYLLDTMVLSEPARPEPNPSVLAWFERQVPSDLAISVLTIGEIGRGVERLAEGRRRTELERWLGVALPRQFEGRVLPVDVAVAQAWGTLTAEADRAGRPLPVVDGLLLATARARDLTMVTRNAGDFDGRGVPVLNPYEGT